MTEAAEGRRYFTANWSNGYPAGSGIRFECVACGDILPSLPAESVACSCRNVTIDVDYGRVSVRDHGVFRAFASEPRAAD